MARILVIDDEPDFCDIIRIFLEDRGHDVETASEVEKVLEYFGHTRPDLVLLDVRMPDVNGLELLPQIKAMTQGCYVVIVTAVNDYRVADLLYEAGADGFLTKPVRLEELDSTIARLLTPSTCHE